MVKQPVPFQEPSHSKQPERKNQPAGPNQSPRTDTENRRSPRPATAYDILARDGTGYHAQHWGINE